MVITGGSATTQIKPKLISQVKFIPYFLLIIHNSFLSFKEWMKRSTDHYQALTAIPGKCPLNTGTTVLPPILFKYPVVLASFLAYRT